TYFESAVSGGPSELLTVSGFPCGGVCIGKREAAQKLQAYPHTHEAITGYTALIGKEVSWGRIRTYRREDPNNLVIGNLLLSKQPFISCQTREFARRHSPLLSIEDAQIFGSDFAAD